MKRRAFPFAELKNKFALMNWGDAACMFNWIMLVVLAVHDLDRTAQRLGDWFCLRFSSYGRPFPGAIHCLAHTDFGFLELSTVEDYRQITKPIWEGCSLIFCKERRGFQCGVGNTGYLESGGELSKGRRFRFHPQKIGNGLEFSANRGKSRPNIRFFISWGW